MKLNPDRRHHDTWRGGRRQRRGVAVLVLGLIGATGCGGGGGSAGGGGASSSQPTALSPGTPTSVTGTAASGLTFTFSEALTTLSGQPEITYTLHEVNNSPGPVTVGAGQDPVTQALFPNMAVRLLDPQGRPVSLPPVTGTRTLTLNSGDTADALLTLNLGYFTQSGRYTATVAADGTEGVPALANALVLSAQ